MFYHRDKKQLTHWLIAKLFSVISVKILALSKQRSLRWTPQAAQPVSQAVFPLPLTDPECLGHIFCSLDPQTPIWSHHSLACSRAASSMESLISSSRDDPFLRYSTTGTHFSYPGWLLSQPPWLSWRQCITPLNVTELPGAADGQLCFQGWHLLSRQIHPSTESCSDSGQLLGYIFICSQTKYLPLLQNKR